MFSEYHNISVIGMAAAVSNHWDSLLEVSDEDPAIIDKFVKKIGVSGRYSASIKQTTSDFCYAAAEKVLTEKGIDRSQIGVLVFVTQTPDYRLPATGCVLQHRLGIGTNCLVFDVNLGCSGFVYGLNILSSLMNSSDAKYGLLLAGDISAREFSSKRKDKLGHSAALLFGDSGTATLVEKQEGNHLLFSSATDGNGYKAIIAPYGDYRNPESPDGRIYYTKMDDVAVFNFATNEAPDQINGYMKRLNTTSEDYDCLVLHQANLMIMKRIANILQKQKQVPENFDKSLFEHASEGQLAEKLTDQETLGKNRKYPELLATLLELRPYVDSFFDSVMVLCEDAKVRDNRLALLHRIHSLYACVADFSALQI